MRDSRAARADRQRGAAAADPRASRATERRSLRHIIVASGPGSPAHESTHTHAQFGLLLAQGAAELDAEPTSRDAPAFWLYSSGSTGVPKGCVHLQHDMVVCAELFGKGVLGIRPTDRMLQRREAVFRVRPRATRCTFRSRSARRRSLAGSADAAECLRGHRDSIGRRCSSPCRPATA